MFTDRRTANRGQLRALCKSCHSRKTALEINLGARVEKP
jgi:5-methylcytosine-specific restriction endonuclease McrA